MTVFVAVSQFSPEGITYALHTAGDPLRYVRTVHEIVREADSRIPVTNVVTQAAEIDRTINRELTFAKLCTGFAVLALLMACGGLYGTMSYNVTREVGEIGIRMALGAQRGAWRRWGWRSACRPVAGVVLLVAVILAGYAPARRASRIDALVALRQD
jgi:macrolide transport system ATP-binding/permease protein